MLRFVPRPPSPLQMTARSSCERPASGTSSTFVASMRVKKSACSRGSSSVALPCTAKSASRWNTMLLSIFVFCSGLSMPTGRSQPLRFLVNGMLPASNACVRDLEGVFVSAAASSGSVSTGAAQNDRPSAAQNRGVRRLPSARGRRAATASVRARALAHKGQMCFKLRLQVPSARTARSRARHVSEQMYRCLSRRSCVPCGSRAVFL